MRHRYYPPRALSQAQQHALIVAWCHFVSESGFALDEMRSELRRGDSGLLPRALARRLASSARDLVAAFGVRFDGRRVRPFPHALPERKAAA